MFVNTPKSVKKKKVNIPAFKGIGKEFVKPILCYVMLIFKLDDDEDVFINTPKPVRAKKVNIPSFKGTRNVNPHL